MKQYILFMQEVNEIQSPEETFVGVFNSIGDIIVKALKLHEDGKFRASMVFSILDIQTQTFIEYPLLTSAEYCYKSIDTHNKRINDLSNDFFTPDLLRNLKDAPKW